MMMIISVLLLLHYHPVTSTSCSWTTSTCAKLSVCAHTTRCDLTYQRISGSFPEQFTGVDVSSVRSLDFSHNVITDVSNLKTWDTSSVTYLGFTNNYLYRLNPNTFQSAKLPFLLQLDLRENPFLYDVIPNTFVGPFQNLERIDFGGCNLRSISSSMLAQFPALRGLNLTGNEISTLEDDVFAPVNNTIEWITLDQNKISKIYAPFRVGFASLFLLLLNDQQYAATELSNHSFSGLNYAGLSIAFGGSVIKSIPPQAFADSCFSDLLLEGVGLVSVSDYAFSDSCLTSISLSQNDVRHMSHLATHGMETLTVTSCTDYPNWSFNATKALKLTSASKELDSLSCDEYTDDNVLADYNQARYLLSFEFSSAGISPLEACCEFRGGNKFGRALVMSDFSTVYCRPETKLNITSVGVPGHVRCGCSNNLFRYDTIDSTCLQSCQTGEKWVPEVFKDEDDAWDAGYLSTRWWQANESVGKCVACIPGRIFDDSTDWPETCKECPAGKYSAVEGGKRCNDCLRNSYAEDGSTKCTTCDFGKTSGLNQQSCVPCNAWTIGSEHCDVPVMGLGIIFLSILVLGGAIVILRRKYKKKSKELKKQTKLLKATADDMKLLSTAWNLEWSDVKLEQLLASGAAGEVWKGTYCSRWKVAVKKMHNDEMNLDNDKEVNFLRRARHNRLVMMIGCGTFEENSRGRTGGVFIVLEYMERGSLDTLIWNNDGSLSWDTRLQLMEDVAEGMAYLHGVHRSIHRDLKSPNVLLGEEGGTLRAKVADFGLARILGSERNKTKEKEETKTVSGFISKRLMRKRKSSENNSNSKEEDETLISSSMTCGAGTSLWMAPELVETIQMEKEGTYEASYSQAVDIYAFGIILNEILTLSRPWSRTDYTWSHEIYSAVLKGERPVATPDERSQAPMGFVRLMELTYHQDVKNRPPFSDIASALNEMRIQHHHSVHGSSSLRASTSSRRSRRTGSMTSLLSGNTGSTDDLLFRESGEFVPLHQGHHHRFTKRENTTNRNSTALMALGGCCAPSPPPKTHLFEMKSTNKKKRSDGIKNSLRIPLLDEVEEKGEDDE